METTKNSRPHNLIWLVIAFRIAGIAIAALSYSSAHSLGRGEDNILIIVGLAMYQLLAAVANLFFTGRNASLAIIGADLIFGPVAIYLGGLSLLLLSIFVPLLETIFYFEIKWLYLTGAIVLVTQAAVLASAFLKGLKSVANISYLLSSSLLQILVGATVLFFSIVLIRYTERFNEERAKFKDQKEFLQEMITKLESDREGLIDTIMNLQKQLEDVQLSSKLELEKRQRELEERMKEMIKERHSLQGELDKCQKEFQDALKALEEAKTEIDELHAQIDNLESLLEIAVVPFSSLVLEETVQNIVELLSRIIEFDGLVVFFRESYRGGFRYVPLATYGDKAEYYMHLTMPEGENLLTLVMREDKPIIIDNSTLRTADGRTFSTLHPEDISAILLPLYIRKKPFGVIYISSSKKSNFSWMTLEPIWKLREYITAALYLSKIHTTTVEKGVRDPETELFNSVFFHEQLRKEFWRARRYNDSFSVTLVKVKNLNTLRAMLSDTEYSVLLKDIGSKLQETVRESDIVARVNEDTFGVLLIKTSRKTGNLVGDRILTSVKSSTFLGKYKLDVIMATASFPADSDELDKLLEILAERLERADTGAGVRRTQTSGETEESQKITNIIDFDL